MAARRVILLQIKVKKVSSAMMNQPAMMRMQPKRSKVLRGIWAMLGLRTDHHRFHRLRLQLHQVFQNSCLLNIYLSCFSFTERWYPKDLYKLAQYINEPDFPSRFKSFLYSIRHPNRPVPDDVETQVNFSGKIHVFHSAIACFYAPSDLCGPCGMYRECIWCNPSWYGHP